MGAIKRRLPKLASEDQERSFWATHDSTAYIDWEKAERLSSPNLKPSLKQYPTTKTQRHKEV
jgi:hypothetical protein